MADKRNCGKRLSSQRMFVWPRVRQGRLSLLSCENLGEGFQRIRIPTPSIGRIRKSAGAIARDDQNERNPPPLRVSGGYHQLLDRDILHAGQAAWLQCHAPPASG